MNGEKSADHRVLTDERMKAFEDMLQKLGANIPKILIIDDEPAVRQYLSRVFARLGFPHIAAETGEQAIDYAESAQFDIAFIDMMLPGKNGFETLKHLKKIHPRIRTVVFTGCHQSGLIQQSIEFGAQAVLEKPFSLTEIFGVVSRLVPGIKNVEK